MREAIVELAHQMAERLGEINGVEAVALGGSWARGEASPDSDVDLGVYYLDEHRPSVEDLRRLAREVGYRHPHELATDFGGWGPWINGGAWLQVEGTPVDWLYREVGQVSRVIEECWAGGYATHYQPGHPHGFHTHIYMGEIHHCHPLHDPRGILKALKSTARQYPPRLKHAVIQNQLWEARFALDTCRKSATRGDTFYVAGCLFRCAACMVQALFALNERFIVNEKGSVTAADSLTLRPADFRETIDSVLSRPGERPEQLEDSVGRFGHLLGALEGLCAEPLRELYKFR